MAKDNQILVRVNDHVNEAVEDFAEDRDYNKAESVRRILESRLKGEGYLSREMYGEDDDENEAVADGGYVRLSDHPWIDPIIRVGNYSAMFGILLTAAAFLSVFVATPLVKAMGVVGLALWIGGFYALAILGTAMGLISVAGIVVLEYLMHPSEAPIRRYFYDHNGEVEVIPS